MPLPCHRKIYSYELASSVIENFCTKYTRATLFFAKKLLMDPKNFKYTLIKLFMYNNVRWNIIRDCLKKVDKEDMYFELARLTKPEFIKYLTAVRSLVEDRQLDLEFLEN